MRISVPDRLEDGVVALRGLKMADAPAYAAAFVDDPLLGRLLGTETDPDEHAVRALIDRQAQRPEDIASFQLAIVDPDTDAFWGSVIVHSLHEEHRRGEVGFWLMAAQRRRGLGSRAVGLAVSWMFEVLDLARVEMTTIPENQAVPALAARLGFTREGVLRSRNVERGRRVDIVWFGLLREEWQGS